jgi:hypothetical protein
MSECNLMAVNGQGSDLGPVQRVMPGMPPLAPLPRSRAAAPAAVVALLLAALVAACKGSNDVGDPCLLSGPGVVAMSGPGLRFQVRDARNRGEALGDTAITYLGNDSVIAVGHDTLQLDAGPGRAGTFDVRVKRRFYRDTLLTNLTVNAGVCGLVDITHVPLTLTLAAGAPPLRAVDIVGPTFILGPGRQNQLTARFDADPSVPTTVVWRLSDTTAARIDGSGLMTGKCITKARIDTVIALATADTTVRGHATFSVANQASCP